MAANQQEVYSGISPALFRALPTDSSALKETCMETYLKALPDFATILGGLQSRGFFVGQETTSVNIHDFLQYLSPIPVRAMSLPPTQLLATPFALAHREHAMDALIELEALPPVYQVLNEEITAYIALIIDVLNNDLAQKPYEQINDRENVTEKEHALQAGKLAYMFGLRLDDILAMLFHDIARPSIDDSSHGHINHANEGSSILAPLGLGLGFCASHGFAKYLLMQFCPPYKKLISKASKHSLGLQTKHLDEETTTLKEMDPLSLAHNCYKLVFFRILDDMSKASKSILEIYLAGAEIEYFSNDLIKKMLIKQFCTRLKKLPNTPSAIQEIKNCLSTAISLLGRARQYSQHPEIYPPIEHLLHSAGFEEEATVSNS